MTDIAANLSEIQERIELAARRSGREASAVQLMVVSKTWPAEIIQEVVDEGHRLFGENRLQEGEFKIPQLPDDLEWHFIGGLQRNKVRKVLNLFSVIHSISSLKLALFTNRVAGELRLRPKVFLEVNLGGEASKGGFSEADLCAQADELAQLENLEIHGLMCIPPPAEQPDAARPSFARLRCLRDQLTAQLGPLPGLSMGMSNDFEVAIEEGSTIVRVGSAIFGPRIK